MNVKIIQVTSLEKNQALAEEFSRTSNLHYLLFGEIGSGKSTFVKHFLNFKGIEYSGSPTFNLIHAYDNFKIIHADFYRLSDKNLSYHLNILDDYLSDDTILFIEWPIKELEQYFKLASTVKICFSR